MEAQKNNNLEAAAADYVKITNLTNVDLKSKAFMALASLYFNNGAAILQKASPIANTEKEKYASEKEKALGNFKKALDYVNQALKLSPESTDVKDLAKQIKDAMK